MTDMIIKVRVSGNSHEINGTQLELQMATNDATIINEVARHLGLQPTVFSGYVINRLDNRIQMHPQAPYA